MKNIKVKVTWDFNDTEFEHLRYTEALAESGLPKVVKISDYDEEDIEIETYLFEEFMFYPKKWSIIE